jgi:hypothetical protein
MTMCMQVTIEIRDTIQITLLLFKFRISTVYSHSLYGMMGYALLYIWCLEHSNVIRLGYCFDTISSTPRCFQILCRDLILQDRFGL